MSEELDDAELDFLVGLESSVFRLKRVAWVALALAVIAATLVVTILPALHGESRTLVGVALGSIVGFGTLVSISSVLLIRHNRSLARQLKE